MATTSSTATKRAIVYALYDQRPAYVTNVQHFLRHGVKPDANHVFVIVVNGGTTSSIRESLERIGAYANVIVVSRGNTGFDFGAYSEGLKTLRKRYDAAHFDQYVFLNSSVRGPYVPRYVPCWVSAFTSLLSDTVKLAGPTINVFKLTGGKVLPHVQSYAFATDRAGLAAILAAGVFDREYDSFLSVVMYQEVAMSQVIRGHPGWTIACFVPEYATMDFRNSPDAERVLTTSNPAADLSAGDIVFPGSLCFGRDLTVMEVMFAKTNRRLFSEASLNAATQLLEAALV